MSAGNGIDLSSCDRIQLPVRETQHTADANFALRVSGDSMEPMYHDGDIVLVRTQPEVDVGEIGIFIVNGCGFIKEAGDGVLVSLNPAYSNIVLNDGDDVYCSGKVIGVLSQDDLAE